MINLLWTFVLLGLVEAVIKPLAKRWVQRRILGAAPAILRAIDARLPELLTLPSGDQRVLDNYLSYIKITHNK